MADNNFFVLWGSAGHAKVLAETIRLKGGSVIALFDNNEVASAIENVPLYFGESGFKNWICSHGIRSRVSGLVAIGGARGLDRIYIQRLFKECGLATPFLVHPAAVISESAQIGEGSQVLALANVAADTMLGECCIVNHHASIDHECVLGDGVHVGPGSTLCGCVTLGDNVFVGAGAIVLPRILVGANTIIGAGTIVTRDIPPDSVVVGNPARII